MLQKYSAAILSSFLLFSVSGHAYVLRAQTIFQKLIENNGSGTYQIEQEVVFTVGAEPTILKEIWQIKDQDTMRLTVHGTRDFKDRLKWTYVYSNGQKTSLQNQTKKVEKIPADFMESYFHFRKTEALVATLNRDQIFSSANLDFKPTKIGKDFVYPADTQIRLARTGGGISYAIGVPSTNEDLNPGLWIEQDQFVIRKLRLPSQAEITTEKISNFSRGLIFPRQRNVRWDNNQVQIQTININGIADRPAAFSGANLENNTPLTVFENEALRQVVDEFYSRFR